MFSLRELWHKPDFPRGQPHLTIYDGKDRAMAEKVFSLLNDYEWNCRVAVSKLRLIQRKHKVDEVLLPSFVAFFEMFEKFVGNPAQILLARTRPRGELERWGMRPKPAAGGGAR
jgi:hypothetical protein